jgi:hypothetical protein
MINLKYLDRFAGTDVSVELMLDPQANNGKKTVIYTGQLTDDNLELNIKLLLGRREIDSGNDLWTLTGTLYLPYLGNTSTLWQIQTSEDGLKLLAHEQIGEKDYKIFGPGGQMLGILNGLEIPYRTIIHELNKEKEGKNGHAYLEAMEEVKRKFNNWRESIFQSFS